MVRIFVFSIWVIFFNSTFAAATVNREKEVIDFSLPVDEVFNIIRTDLSGSEQDWEETLQLSERYFAFLEVNPIAISDRINAYSKAGDLYGEYGKVSDLLEISAISFDFYKKAYELAETSFGKFSPAFLKNLNLAAWASLQIKKNNQALELAEKWRKSRNLIGLDDHQYFYLLGEIYFENGDYENSAIALKKYLTLLESNLEVSQLDLATLKRSYATTLYELGLFDESLKNLFNAMEHAKLGKHFNELQKIYSDLGSIYDATQKFEQQEKVILQAISYFENFLPAAEHNWLAARYELVEYYYRVNRYDDAYPLAHNILNYFEENLGGPQFASCEVHNSIGLLEKHYGNYELAKSIFKKIIKEASSYINTSCSDASFVNLATLYVDLENYDEAEKLFKEALGHHDKPEKLLSKSGNDNTHVAYVYFQYAEMLTFQVDRYAEGEEFYKYALELNKKSAYFDPTFDIVTTQRLSQLYFELENNTKALEYARTSYDQLNRFINEWETTDASATAIDTFRWVAEYVALLFFSLTDDPDLEDQMDELIEISFQSAQLARITAAQLASRYSSVRSSMIKNNSKDIFDSIKLTTLKLSKLQKEIDEYLLSASSTEEGIFQLLNARTNLRKKIDVLRLSSGKVLDSVLSVNQSISILEIQEQLADHEAFILVAPTYYGDAHLVYVIDKEGYLVGTADYSLEQAYNDVAAVRKSLAVTLKGDLNLFDFGSSSRIYNGIFKDYIEYIEKESAFVNSIKYTVYGPLQSLPLSLLLVDETKQAFLIDKFDLALIPSANSLRHLARPKINANSNFLGIGNSNFMGNRYANLRGISFVEVKEMDLHSRITMLSKLPDTENEIRSLSNLFKGPNNTIHLGREANEAAFSLEDFSNYDVVAIATHGVQSEELLNLSEPALLLPFGEEDSVGLYDGALTASEIASMDFDNEIVLLSACNTAYGDQDYNETLSGLTAAFLGAGTKSLYVSNWAIDSSATSDLTTKIFKNLLLEENISPAKALQKAMLNTRQQGYKHPFYWASISYAGR